MGCSSSKGSRSARRDTEDLVTGVPKLGIHQNGDGKAEFDDKSSQVHSLLLKKNQKSIEGRQNQVRHTAVGHCCGFRESEEVWGLAERRNNNRRFDFFVFDFFMGVCFDF